MLLCRYNPENFDLTPSSFDNIPEPDPKPEAEAEADPKPEAEADPKPEAEPEPAATPPGWFLSLEPHAQILIFHCTLF